MPGPAFSVVPAVLAPRKPICSSAAGARARHPRPGGQQRQPRRPQGRQHRSQVRARVRVAAGTASSAGPHRQPAHRRPGSASRTPGCSGGAGRPAAASVISQPGVDVPAARSRRAAPVTAMSALAGQAPAAGSAARRGRRSGPRGSCGAVRRVRPDVRRALAPEPKLAMTTPARRRLASRGRGLVLQRRGSRTINGRAQRVGRAGVSGSRLDPGKPPARSARHMAGSQDTVTEPADLLPYPGRRGGAGGRGRADAAGRDRPASPFARRRVATAGRVRTTVQQPATCKDRGSAPARRSAGRAACPGQAFSSVSTGADDGTGSCCPALQQCPPDHRAAGCGNPRGKGQHTKQLVLIS